MRLDVAVVKSYPQLSRSRAAKLIEEGSVQVNGAIQKKPSFQCKDWDKIEADIPPQEEYKLIPRKMELDIIYEDDHLAVINKPRGLVVHPAPGHLDDTLVHGLIAKYGQLSDVGGEFRPGIVHRIDKDTTGLLVIAKDNQTHGQLKEQLENKDMKREYLCICKGSFSQQEFEVEKPIGRHPIDRKRMAIADGGRFARTRFFVLDQRADFSLLRCELDTGRTHQIRVHMMSLGHSIVGDLLYGRPGKVKFDGQALHAYKLSFTHPQTKEKMMFTANPPEDFIELARKCKLTLPRIEEIDKWMK